MTISLIFLQNCILTSDQMGILLTRRVELLAYLRPNAVALVDSFDFPDRILNSCLGRYDGQVYDALYEYAKSSSLNQHQVSGDHCVGSDWLIGGQDRPNNLNIQSEPSYELV